MRHIFCGNLEYDARQCDLERMFRRYGKVDRVDMKSGLSWHIHTLPGQWMGFSDICFLLVTFIFFFGGRFGFVCYGTLLFHIYLSHVCLSIVMPFVSPQFRTCFKVETLPTSQQMQQNRWRRLSIDAL